MSSMARLLTRRVCGLLAALVVAGCASASTHGSQTSLVSPSPTVSVTVSTNGASVALTKGQTLQVELPAQAQKPSEKTTYGVLPSGSPVLTSVPGAAGSFTAAADGTAQVTVTQAPICSPGDECPAHIVNVGTVTVTVSG